MAEDQNQPGTRGAHHPSDIAKPDMEKLSERQPYATEGEAYSKEHPGSPQPSGKEPPKPPGSS